MTNSETSRRSHRKRAQEIAAMFAIAVIPRTFQSSLLPRSTVDQGVATSITVVMVYMLGVLTQDVVDATAKVVVNRDESDSTPLTTRMLISAAAVGVGMLSQKLNEYSPGEKLPKSAARTFGQWVKYVGIGGLIIESVSIANATISKDKKAAQERDLLPYFIGAGLLYSLVGEYTRAKSNSNFSLKQSLIDAKPVRVVGIAAGAAALLGGLVYGERLVARKVDTLLDTPSRKLKPNWLPAGHLVGVGMIGAGIYAYVHKTYNSIEQGADKLEAGFLQKPRVTEVSGSAKSLVDWNSLSIQGRRHTGTVLSASKIKAVMGEDAVQPIRIFVGLDSAETKTMRVQLALDELERTKAYDRDYILVVSPTGTGYVNYVMSEAAEYQTLGNIASVTVQYSKRPSLMSLDRVDDGHIQYRMLLNGISKRVRRMSARRRPRILLFGESLGAWTSQDALIHSGTDGLQALHVDRALWIGTPMGSKWKDQVLSNDRLNTEEGLVGVFNSYKDVEQLDTASRNSLRYVMLTHYNDPIAEFALSLLIKQPEWVTDETKRPEGISSKTIYRSPTLFVQTLLDMKNALKPIPGQFVSSAHDYRADLARFVAFSYGFTVKPAQMKAIENALRINEVDRERRIKGDA